MNFELRKKEALLKTDKSRKDSWDEKIIPLLNKINKLENYFTTSSCSGRALLYSNSIKKHDCKWFYYSHEKLKSDIIWQELKKAEKFMQDNNDESICFFNFKGVILHFASIDLDSAFNLLNLGRECGLKKGGVFSKNKIISELIAPETIEVPVINNKKLIITREFVEIMCQETNKLMDSTWNRIKKFEDKITLASHVN